MSAPRSTPEIEPIPPSTTMETTRIDSQKRKDSGVTNCSQRAKRAPANPAKAAERVKARSL
jgi:hypothetical protein